MEARLEAPLILAPIAECFERTLARVPKLKDSEEGNRSELRMNPVGSELGSITQRCRRFRRSDFLIGGRQIRGFGKSKVIVGLIVEGRKSKPRATKGRGRAKEGQGSFFLAERIEEEGERKLVELWLGGVERWREREGTEEGKVVLEEHREVTGEGKVGSLGVLSFCRHLRRHRATRSLKPDAGDTCT
uniref:Uncharacterized protein n=1 Tax=Vespula pensylvanica TaxID=30213 RepID=A0A834JPE5_VESPE|nr:hypothetical protein H0235_017362 [Vespula pensylvanica]